MTNTYLRVDDRLVHGQVLYGWGKQWPASEIWLVDNDVASDEAERGLYEELIQSHWNGGVVDLQRAISMEPVAAGNRLLVVRDVPTALSLLSGGVQIDQFMLANVATGKGRSQFADHVFLTDEEVESLRSLRTEGLIVVIHDLPTDEPQDPFELVAKEEL